MSMVVLYIGTPPDSRFEAGHSAKAAGIARYAEVRGWDIVSVPWSRGTLHKVLSILRRERPAGCIVECSGSIGPWLRPSVFGETPTVWLDCREGLFGPKVPTVICDQEAVAGLAFRELQSLRPAALGVVSYRQKRFWSKSRAKTFRILAAEVHTPCRSFAHRIHQTSADEVSLRGWLATLPRRTALFCVNDNLAAAVLAAATEAGLAVPRDLMILGVDNRDATEANASIGVSSIQIDFERAGYLAALTLDAVMHGAQVDPHAATFGPSMVVRRRSTGGVRRADPNILEAMRIIRAEACDGLSAAEVARRVRGSRSLVDLRFREATGHSILDEILHVRLEKACLLLSGTKTSISAISSFCGFESENALLKTFRSRFGVPMRQWRKLHAMPGRY